MKKSASSILFLFLMVLSGSAQNHTDTIVLKTSTGEIEGSLLLPENRKDIPVALLIAGSGPTDRDGNNPMMKNNSLKMLAEGLADQGIASLRYDKRGIGASSKAAVSEAEIRFEHFVDDARDWIDLLQNDPRFSGITVIGHSEGSLIGMIAAQDKDCKFVSVAGVGEAAGNVIRKQLEAQSPRFLEAAEPIIEQLEQGMTADSIPPLLMNLFRPSVQPYIISWFRYNPGEEIVKLKAPVLIIQGSTDIQVSIEDAEMLAAANQEAQKIIIEGMNHVLKTAEADRTKNMQTYFDPNLPLADGLVQAIAGFIIE